MLPTIEYADEVPELPGWRFVKDDLYKIAERVERYENGRTRLARYVAKDGHHPEGQLGVMREFHGELDVNDPSRKKWWVIAIRCLNDNGQPMCGLPDQRILRDMERFDTWTRHHGGSKQMVALAHKIREQRDKLEQESFRERIDEDAGKIVKEHKRRMSINDSAFFRAKEG